MPQGRAKEGAPAAKPSQQGQPPQAQLRQPVPPVASPQEHASLAQQLKELASQEPDPKAAERLNSLASLNEGFSKPPKAQQPAPTPTSSAT